MADEVIQLEGVKKEEVPAELRSEMYFDFKSYPFEHQKLFEDTNSIPRAIYGIHDYAVGWLAKTIEEKRSSAKSVKNKVPQCKNTTAVGNFEVLLEDGAVFAPSCVIGSAEKDSRSTIYLGKGAKVIGTNVYLDNGSIYIGNESIIEAGAGIKGPTIIGDRTEIRQSAYLRGDCIIGDDGSIRSEIKNSVLMNEANFPHISYHGDSACGYHTHFAGGMGTANLSIFGGMVDKSKRKNLTIKCEGKKYDIGGTKMGLCMGDFCQIGGNGRSDPGTFLKPYTVVYMLTRITKGFYGPNVILKNKPMEHGIIEQAQFDPGRLG